MNSIKKIFIIFFIVLIAFILLLEISLRIVGFVHLNKTYYDKSSLSNGRDSGYTILFLGDSFTFGIGASSEKSMPSQLQEIFNVTLKGKQVRVINRGIPSCNTSNILNELPSYLSTMKPDLIILLTGGNNGWNYYGYHTFLKRNDLFTVLLDQLYRIRVYKLIKLIVLNIRSELDEHESTGNRYLAQHDFLTFMPDSVPYAYGIDGKYKEAMEWFKNAIHDDPTNSMNYLGISHVYREQGNYDEAIRWLKEGVKVQPRYGPYYNAMGDIYRIQGKYEESVKWYKKAVTIAPDEEVSYSRLIKLYRLTHTHYDEIMKFLSEMAEDHPAALNWISILEEEDIHQKTDEWVKSDIKKIIRLCQEEEIKIILQNYPYLQGKTFYDPRVNEVINGIAEECSLPLVDNCRIFNELPNKEGYFISDGHCNYRGYRVMAQNVYDKIIEEKIFDGDDS